MTLRDPYMIELPRLRGWRVIVKPSNEDKTNNTLTEDTTLSFTLAAGRQYIFEVVLLWDSASSTPSFKAELQDSDSALSVSAVTGWGVRGATTVISGGQGDITGGNIGITLATGITSGAVIFKGWLLASGNGRVGVFWAQSVTNATATTLKRGSYVELREVQ